MSAWLPQASYPCGNFSDTSSLTPPSPKGSIGRDFSVRTRTGRSNQVSFCPFAPCEISVLAELTLGHLRYSLTDVPPQPNSPPGTVGCDSWIVSILAPKQGLRPLYRHTLSKAAMRVVVFHCRQQLGFDTKPTDSHLSYSPHAPSPFQTRVKLNRVFFPR